MQLFQEEEQTPVTAPGQTHATGILPAHGIRNMIRAVSYTHLTLPTICSV